MLILKRPWTRQPQGAQRQLRPEFATNATSLVVGNRLDLISKQLYGFSAIQATLNGMSGAEVGTNSPALLANAETVLPDGTEFTLVFVNDSAVNVGAPQLCQFSTAGARTSEFHIYLRFTDGNAYFRWGGSTDGATSVSGPAPSSQGTWVVSTGPYGMQIWRNGALIASNAATPTRAAAGPGASLTANAGAASTFTTPLLGMWNKQFPPAISRSVSSNPWQLFAPQQIIIPTPAAAASAPTITALSAIGITATSAQPRISYS